MRITTRMPLSTIADYEKELGRKLKPAETERVESLFAAEVVDELTEEEIAFAEQKMLEADCDEIVLAPSGRFLYKAAADESYDFYDPEKPYAYYGVSTEVDRKYHEEQAAQFKTARRMHLNEDGTVMITEYEYLEDGTPVVIKQYDLSL